MKIEAVILVKASGQTSRIKLGTPSHSMEGTILPSTRGAGERQRGDFCKHPQLFLLSNFAVAVAAVVPSFF